MQIPFSWLAEYVDVTGLTPEEVAEALTRSGLEIESLEAVGPKFEGVIVANVLALEPHPNADKLRLVTLEVAPNTTQQVVCGAPNVAVGQKIAFAQDGATVYSRKDETWFTLKPAVIRGVNSKGMVCALDELQLAEQYPIDAQEPGIWVLNTLLPNAMAGTCLKEALQLPSDIVLDAAIPANRGDLMGILGVAREVAALFQRPFTSPEIAQGHYPTEATPQAHFALELPDATVCQSYQGGLLTSVQVAPSPTWMQQRLTWAGMRAINNVVDITNYVMLETGHPLHAFDRFQLDDANTPFLIRVERASSETTFTTLDETTLTLDSSIPVVTCNEAPVALAGIKGGLHSGISDSTHTLLLESAVFPSALIRKASKKVGVRTESSARFERGTDPSRQALAFQRATHLLASLCGANPVASQRVFAEQTSPQAPPKLHLTMAYFEQLTGMTMTAQEARKILEPLGFTCVPSQDEENLTLEVPAWRTSDIQHPADVVEELLRIKGYDHVPYTLPAMFQFPKPTPWAVFQRRMNTFLQGTLQCDEWMTNSLVSYEQETQWFPEAGVVALNNAKSPDHNALRTQLIPSMLASVARHTAHKVAPALRAYEWGRVYQQVAQVSPELNPKETGVQESLRLGVVLAHLGKAPSVAGGMLALEAWQESKASRFWEAKGTVEALLKSVVGLPSHQVVWSADITKPLEAFLHPGQSATCFYQQHPKASLVPLATVGVVHPQWLKQEKVRGQVAVIDFDTQALFTCWQKHHAQYKGIKPLAQHPSIERDLALLLPRETSWQEVYQAITSKHKAPLQQVQVFDVFHGEPTNPLPEGQKSLALRLRFQNPEVTLTDEEVKTHTEAILKTLTAKCHATLR